MLKFINWFNKELNWFGKVVVVVVLLPLIPFIAVGLGFVMIVLVFYKMLFKKQLESEFQMTKEDFYKVINPDRIIIEDESHLLGERYKQFVEDNNDFVNNFYQKLKNGGGLLLTEVSEYGVYEYYTFNEFYYRTLIKNDVLNRIEVQNIDGSWWFWKEVL